MSKVYWSCPWCGCTDIWIDRPFVRLYDGTVEQLKDCCIKCKRIVGSSPDCWKCPKCGGTEQWFDRTITCDEDGNEIEGMKDRCIKCGIPTDKWIKDNAS